MKSATAHPLIPPLASYDHLVDLIPASILEQKRLNHPHTKESARHNLELWCERSWSQLATRLSDEKFPCIFARKAFERQSLLACFANDPTLPAAKRRVTNAVVEYLNFIRQLPVEDAVWSTLVILFEPQKSETVFKMHSHIKSDVKEESDVNNEKYHDQAWNLLQYLHDNDPQPWPAHIPTDPNDAMWSFCFDGEPLFVNISTPAHTDRVSRNLGDGLALIIQPRPNFDRVAGLHSPGGKQVREHIRQRMQAYDGQPHPSDLGTYGCKDNLEWKQYALQDTNANIPVTCPLKIHGKHKDVTSHTTTEF